MFEIPVAYKDALIEILEWNQRVYCDPTVFPNEFRTRLNYILNKLIGAKEKIEIEKRYLVWLKEAVENAKDYVEECGVPKAVVADIFHWIHPLYLQSK